MKYPIGIQTFQTIIQDGFVYVDKTRSVYKLLTEGNIYFLSRPRRFGKSLMLSTLKAIFEGKQHLFKGLFIENKIEWKKHPIIHISLNTYSNKEVDLRLALWEDITAIAKDYGLSLERTSLGGRFTELMHKLSQQEKVVLLIDEYDKPLISFLEDIDTFEKNRAILKEFYGVIKDSDEALRLVFITGVSRFSKVSIFSDLNNVTDISLDADFCDICGYSEEDMHHYFTERIIEIAAEMNIPTEELFEKVKKKYNGYNFGGNIKMYNPWSVLNFLRTGKLDNYWFATGTPTFLTKFVDNMQTVTEGIVVDKIELGSLNFQGDNLPTLLYQTGYLTIDKEVDDGLLRLVHPNGEVSEAFRLYLLGYYTHVLHGTIRYAVLKLQEAMKAKNEQGLKDALNPIFANIPSHIFDQNSEAYYHAVMHLIFMMLHFKIQSEVNTNAGRIGSVVEAWNEVWIFEFKLNKSAQVAYNQIIRKNYAAPYMHTGKDIYGVGMNFDSKKKIITQVKMQKLS